MGHSQWIFPRTLILGCLWWGFQHQGTISLYMNYKHYNIHEEVVYWCTICWVSCQSSCNNHLLGCNSKSKRNKSCDMFLQCGNGSLFAIKIYFCHFSHSSDCHLLNNKCLLGYVDFYELTRKMVTSWRRWGASIGNSWV